MSQRPAEGKRMCLRAADYIENECHVSGVDIEVQGQFMPSRSQHAGNRKYGKMASTGTVAARSAMSIDINKSRAIAAFFW